MDIGESIDFIRSRKNIKVKDLCGDNFTRQTYRKFVTGETNTSSKNFLILLDNLCVSCDEFIFIMDGYKIKDYEAMMNQIKNTFESNNPIGLQKLAKECAEIDQIRFFHLYHICILLSGKLNNNIDEESSNIIRTYLFNVDTWTHYEIMIFNNIMFCFETEVILVLLDTIVINLDKYKHMKRYGSEGFRLYVNVILLFLQRNEWKHVNTYIEVLNQYPITEDSLFEKNVLLFFKGILLILTHNKEGNSYVEQSLLIFEMLDSERLHQMFKSYYNYILEKNLEI